MKIMSAISDIEHQATQSDIKENFVNGENFVGQKVSYSNIGLGMIAIFKGFPISDKPNIRAVSDQDGQCTASFYFAKLYVQAMFK